MDNNMDKELTQNELGRGSFSERDGHCRGTTGSPGMAPASILTLPASSETCLVRMCSGLLAFQRQQQSPAFQTNLDDAYAAALPPGPLDSFSWEATMPVAARIHEFVITELRRVPRSGLNHFVPSTSSNGKPLYGAYVRSSEGQLCLQQLFEFSQTALEAGVFLPVPTVGRLYEGDYGLEYVRHRFFGSVARLPEILRLPARPTSSGDRRALLEGTLEPAATAITPPPSVAISDDKVYESADSLMVISTPRPPPPSPAGETTNRSAVSTFVSPSYNDFASFNQEPTPLEILDALANSAPPCSLSSSCTNEGESPIAIKTADEPPQPQVQQQPVDAAAPCPSDPSASKARVPDRCQSFSLCVGCKKFWGISGLPGKHFQTGDFSTPEQDPPATLCSEKTAARKKKWAQCRHGPKSKTSEYRGVNLYKRTWKWESHIWHNGEQLYLGASVTKTHAAQVYDRAALFLFGPDAEINFEPERYQQEYEFMQRLSYGQMVIYLRRESRQNGEEVRYPGVAKVKSGKYSASYRPRKEKESHELIGYFSTEDEAARAVLKEARRRRNYEMAAKILDVHHLRSVRPATGKTKQKRKSRAASIVAALKVLCSKPSSSTSKRTQRAAARSNSVIQTQAAARPTLEVAIAPPTRQFTKNTPKSEPADVVTATVPGLTADSGQEPESAPAVLTRTYVRKWSRAKGKTVLKEDTVEPASDAVAAEAPPSQKARAAVKRKYSRRSKSSPAAQKRASEDPLTLPLQEMLTDGEPSGSPTPLRRNRPRLCNYTPRMSSASPCRPPELINMASASVHSIGTVSPPTTAAPTLSQFPIPSSRSRPFIANATPFPRVYSFRSVNTSTGSKSGSHGPETHGSSSADREGEWTDTPGSRESGCASSNNLPFQTVALAGSKRVVSPVTLEEAKAEAIRQFQEACDRLVIMQRRPHLHAGENPRLSEPDLSKSPGVIRPVARRLSLKNLQPNNLQPGEAGAASSGAAQGTSANRVPPGRRGGGGQLYIDLFGA